MHPKTKNILTQYCKRGFHLFPIKKETKRPAILNNLKLASIDIDQLVKWESRFPDCNWGIALSKSKLVAVDVDHSYGGFEAWDTLINLKGEPDTLKAITGSGGFHYVFKATALRYRGKIQAGIDIKYNGYIVIYPSTHQSTGKRYRWSNWRSPITVAPEWLKLLIEKDDALVGKRNPTYKFGNKYLQRLVKTLKEYEITYQEWVQAGMAIHESEPNEEGLQLYLDLTEGASYQEGDLEKASAKWSSFSKRSDGISPLTLGYIIRNKGGVVPNPYYEEDMKAFKEAKIQEITRNKESDNFVEEGGKLVCWKREQIVEEFNDKGFAYLIGGGRAPFLRVRKDQDGEMDLLTMEEKGIRTLTAPWFFAQLRETANDCKKIITPAYREWLESPRRKTYRKIVFKPTAGKDELNLWTRLSPLEPIYDHDPRLILDMILDSLCNSDPRKYNWLLDWLAHLVQRPWERCSTVPVLIGPQGAGKGVLFDDLMKPILKGHFTAITTSSELMQQFNVHLSRKFLTFIDEATWRGNKTEDGYLKRLIGSPTMSVEEKFGLRYDLENFSRYAIASNNKEAVALEIGNRRYVIIESSKRYAADTVYFGKIYDALEDEETIRGFYGLLKRRTLENFNPHKILEGNLGGRESKIATVGPIAMFWEDVIFETPRKLWLEDTGLYMTVVFEEFLAFCRNIRTYEKAITAKKFWSVTRMVVPTLPDRKSARMGEAGKSIKVIDIPIEKFIQSFCKTLEIAVPIEVDYTEFYIEDLFEI